jgi:hypothetical protein
LGIIRVDNLGITAGILSCESNHGRLKDRHADRLPILQLRMFRGRTTSTILNQFATPGVLRARWTIHVIGYAPVSTQDQNLELQTEALTKAGCKKVFEDEIFVMLITLWRREENSLRSR